MEGSFWGQLTLQKVFFRRVTTVVVGVSSGEVESICYQEEEGDTVQ